MRMPFWWFTRIGGPKQGIPLRLVVRFCRIHHRGGCEHYRVLRTAYVSVYRLRPCIVLRKQYDIAYDGHDPIAGQVKAIRTTIRTTLRMCFARAKVAPCW